MTPHIIFNNYSSFFFLKAKTDNAGNNNAIDKDVIPIVDLQPFFFVVDSPGFTSVVGLSVGFSLVVVPGSPP